jgi:hypothetical protein
VLLPSLLTCSNTTRRRRRQAPVAFFVVVATQQKVSDDRLPSPSSLRCSKKIRRQWQLHCLANKQKEGCRCLLGYGVRKKKKATTIVAIAFFATL